MKTFSFIDESGALLTPQFSKSNLFGLGLLKHKDVFTTIQHLHSYHEQLCSKLKKDDTRIEFSFKGVTEKTFDITLNALDVLEKDPNWEFGCIYFDTNLFFSSSKLSPADRWNIYIENIKLLINKNLHPDEETILVADFLRKPRESNKELKYIMKDVPQVYNVLQVISHGALLVQMADLLLGGFLYNEGGYGDKMRLKTEVANKVLDIRKSVGEERFRIIELSDEKSR